MLSMLFAAAKETLQVFAGNPQGNDTADKMLKMLAQLNAVRALADRDLTADGRENVTSDFGSPRRSHRFRRGSGLLRHHR